MWCNSFVTTGRRPWHTLGCFQVLHHVAERYWNRRRGRSRHQQRSVRRPTSGSPENQARSSLPISLLIICDRAAQAAGPAISTMPRK
jgi:hypothetical protein